MPYGFVGGGVPVGGGCDPPPPDEGGAMLPLSHTPSSLVAVWAEGP